jgi:hypothetical protein
MAINLIFVGVVFMPSQRALNPRATGRRMRVRSEEKEKRAHASPVCSCLRSKRPAVLSSLSQETVALQQTKGKDVWRNSATKLNRQPCDSADQSVRKDWKDEKKSAGSFRELVEIPQQSNRASWRRKAQANRRRQQILLAPPQQLLY